MSMKRPVGEATSPRGEGKVHELLLLQDRYEELIETMDELGVVDRSGAEARLAELNRTLDEIEQADG